MNIAAGRTHRPCSPYRARYKVIGYIGGHRIALHVDAIAARRKTSGVTGTIGRVPLSEGAAGPSILHFAPRRGLPSEGVNHPPGMAYETDGGPAPWSDTDPAR